MKIVKIVKSQTLISFIFKCEFQKNECGFRLERSKLVKTDKIVRSQNVTFDLKKSKFDFDLNVKLSYCP